MTHEQLAIVARVELRFLLDCYPQVAQDLLDDVRAGRIDGRTYDEPYKDDCLCLVGQVADHARIPFPKVLDQLRDAGEIKYSWREAGQEPDQSATLPLYACEWWVRREQPGNTPASSPDLARLEQWIVEWMDHHHVQA